MKRGLPAVIAMQYELVDKDTARRFSGKFYKAIALGSPVDFAANEARQVLAAEKKGASRDWSTSVLYLGTQSGDVFRFLSMSSTQGQSLPDGTIDFGDFLAYMQKLTR